MDEDECKGALGAPPPFRGYGSCPRSCYLDVAAPRWLLLSCSVRLSVRRFGPVPLPRRGTGGCSFGSDNIRCASRSPAAYWLRLLRRVRRSAPTGLNGYSPWPTQLSGAKQEDASSLASADGVVQCGADVGGRGRQKETEKQEKYRELERMSSFDYRRQ